MTIHIPFDGLANVHEAAQTCQNALDTLGIKGDIIEDHRHSGMDLYLPDAHAAQILGTRLETESAGLAERILRAITLDGEATANTSEEAPLRTLPRITLDQALQSP